VIDCAIVGAGPAGLAAAIQAVRQGLACDVFECAWPAGQLRAARWIENLPGFPEGISGRALAERLVQQAADHHVRIRREAVAQINRVPEGFSVSTEAAAVLARSVIVACGLAPKPLCIPGEERQLSRRLFAYVDPATVDHAGKSVLVIGGGDAAFDQALAFAAGAARVTIAMRGAAPRCIPVLAERAAAAGIEVFPGLAPRSIDEGVDGLRIAFMGGAGPAVLRAEIVVACVGKESRLGFLPQELREPDAPGIFWAGDCCRGKHRHIAIAMGDGVAAAMAAFDFLEKE
jgi:thioredoxin reductase (NADPH)